MSKQCEVAHSLILAKELKPGNIVLRDSGKDGIVYVIGSHERRQGSKIELTMINMVTMEAYPGVQVWDDYTFILCTTPERTEANL